MAKPLLLLAQRSTRHSAPLQTRLEEASASYRFRTLSYSSVEDVEQALDEIPTSDLLDTILVFDLAGYHFDSWAIGQFDQETGTVAFIALAYPEIYCIVHGPRRDQTGFACPGDHFEEEQTVQLLAAIDQHRQGFRNWFDARRLRAALSRNLWDHAKSPSAYGRLTQSRLDFVAAVAEDERNFLLLEAYAVYRFGYAVYLLPTKSEFNRHLSTASKGDPGARQHFKVLITDWQLTYADQRGDADPELVRTIETDRIGAVIVVTNSRRLRELDEWRKDKDNVGYLSKPIAGIHSLPKAGSAALTERKHVYVEAAQPRPVDPTTSRQHDAPFISVRIAHKLMYRAKRIQKDQVDSVETAVQVALLAGEAKEILGGLSRTLSFEALSLQNAAETRAEALFFGTSIGRTVVSDRIDLLKQETHRIGGSKQSDDFSASERNCVLRTIQDTRKTYSEFEQYEAAEECLRQYSEHESIKWPMRAFYGYCDAVTDSGTSVGRLMSANFAIVVAFAFVFLLLLRTFNPTMSLWFQMGYALAHSLFSFVEISPGPPEWQSLRDIGHQGAIPPLWIYPLEFLELAIGYLNLGLLISLLYRKITRRSP